MKRKRYIKLLMGRLMLSRNEANYMADVTGVRMSGRRGGGPAGSLGKHFAGGGKTGGQNDADQH